jgi:hypothetical protein
MSWFVAGLVFNGLHIFQLAAETDERIQLKGRLHLDIKPLQHGTRCIDIKQLYYKYFLQLIVQMTVE